MTSLKRDSSSIRLTGSSEQSHQSLNVKFEMPQSVEGTGIVISTVIAHDFCKMELTLSYWAFTSNGNGPFIRAKTAGP